MASTTASSSLTVVAENSERVVSEKEKAGLDDVDKGTAAPNANANASQRTGSVLSRLFKPKCSRKKCCNNTQKTPSKKGGGFHPMQVLSDFGTALFRLFARPRFQPGYRKPVIYLYSPTEMDVDVSVSLLHGLTFSVMYPAVPITKQVGLSEQAQWSVRTHLDGSLTEISTGLDVSYLYWEAEILNTAAPLSPPRSPVMGQPSPDESFSPTNGNLRDWNSVVLRVSDVPLYLDRALRALGLNTEARTSFITFWLPSLEKHKFVALRFVPQSAYERTAPMTIKPTPEVATRVFMVFQGISERSAQSEWPNAVARAEQDVGWWQDVVGVDLERALDPTLFRVLEWGGMECKC